MKNLVMAVGIMALFLSVQLYAADGDLIVNGKLGVGTTSPGTEVDVVNGNVRVYQASDRPWLTLQSGVNNLATLRMQNIGRIWDINLQTDGGLDFWNDYLNNVAFTIKQNGNIGIGTTSPTRKLQVGSCGDGDSNTTALVAGTLAIMQPDGRQGIYIQSYNNWQCISAYNWATNTHLNLKLTPNAGDGRVGIGMDPTRKLCVNGDAGGATPWYNDSDERLKKNIVTIENALKKVEKLRGVNFEWRDTENHPEGLQMGLIAQEVKTVVPEVVSKKGEYYSLATSSLVGLLVEAIKDQQKIIEAQDARIKALEKSK